MRSLLLDTVKWDLCLDAAGNIAVASNPYALAQDAACAIRTFQGEVFYNTRDGLPYWESVLGKFPPLALMREYFIAAAMTVPGVVAARVYFLSWEGRRLKGQVQITDKAGVISAASF
jgi:hypothetical protein